MPHDAFLDDGTIVQSFGLRVFLPGVTPTPTRYCLINAKHSSPPLIVRVRQVEKSPMVIAAGAVTPYHVALTQRYVAANGRLHHFTDEQLRWLQDLRPRVLLAEKQRAFHESISEEDEHTEDVPNSDGCG